MGLACRLASLSLIMPGNPHDPLWYPNSGASHHLTAQSNNLSTKTPYTGSEKVSIGNGSRLPIHSIGIATYTDLSTHNTFSLTNLLHVPSISKNLLSVSRFARENFVFFEFYPDMCFVKRQGTNEILLQGKLDDGLYVFPNLVHNTSCSAYVSVVPSSTYNIWHSRFGHAQPKVIHQIMKHCNIPYTATREFCTACVIGKSHQQPFHTSQTVYSKPLQLVFIDIWGPSYTPATNGACYYIAFVDAYTKYVWLYLIHSKAQALYVFQSFKLYAEKQTGFSLLSIQTDNAKEFLCFKNFLSIHGITHIV